MPTHSSENARSFLSPSFRLGGMLDFILFLAIACSWLGCLRDVHWFLALFDHFRLQGAVGCFLALVLLLVRKRWIFAAVAAFSLTINVWPLWKTSFPLPANITADGTRGLKLICFNVLTSNPKHAEVLTYLQQADADVVVLLEINDAWMNSLKPLRQSHPNIIAAPEEHNFGLAVFSRLPLSQSVVRKFAGEEVNSTVTMIEHEGKMLRLIGTHPMPPTGEEATEASLGQLQAIAKFVATSVDVPTIVMGISTPHHGHRASMHFGRAVHWISAPPNPSGVRPGRHETSSPSPLITHYAPHPCFSNNGNLDQTWDRTTAPRNCW